MVIKPAANGTAIAKIVAFIKLADNHLQRCLLAAGFVRQPLKTVIQKLIKLRITSGAQRVTTKHQITTVVTQCAAIASDGNGQLAYLIAFLKGRVGIQHHVIKRVLALQQ